MSTKKTKITADKGKQELFIAREFDAPVDMVYKAFTDPEILVQWMGPKDLSMRIEKLDNKTHGSYRFDHIDKDGNEFGFNGVIHEVDAPHRVIRTFEFEGMPERGHVALEFLTLEKLPDDRTRAIMQSVFRSVEDRDGMVQSGMETGVNEGFSKLDEILDKKLVS